MRLGGRYRLRPVTCARVYRVRGDPGPPDAVSHSGAAWSDVRSMFVQARPPTFTADTTLASMGPSRPCAKVMLPSALVPAVHAWLLPESGLSSLGWPFRPQRAIPGRALDKVSTSLRVPRQIDDKTGGATERATRHIICSSLLVSWHAVHHPSHLIHLMLSLPLSPP